MKSVFNPAIALRGVAESPYSPLPEEPPEDPPGALEPPFLPPLKSVTYQPVPWRTKLVLLISLLIGPDPQASHLDGAGSENF